VWSAKLQRSQMALMRRGAPAPPPLRLGALLVLCSLSGLAVPVGSGSAAGELSAAAPLLPLLPPPVASRTDVDSDQMSPLATALQPPR
jgi:hypothetical protein